MMRGCKMLSGVPPLFGSDDENGAIDTLLRALAAPALLLYVARRAQGGAFPDARRTSPHEPAFR